MNNINLSLKALTENPLVPFIVRLSTRYSAIEHENGKKERAKEWY